MNFAHEGRYRGTILETFLVESKGETSSVSISMLVRWNEFYFPAEADLEAGWGEIDPFDETARVCIVKRDGTINDFGIKQLRAALEWNGDWEALQDNSMQGRKIQALVKAESYDGKTTLRASWIYHYEAEVGSGAPQISEDRFAALARRFGPQTRALCSAEGAAPKTAARAVSRQAPSRAATGPRTEPTVDGNEIPY